LHPECDETFMKRLVLLVLAALIGAGFAFAAVLTGAVA
jgi:hypothetical protein